MYFNKGNFKEAKDFSYQALALSERIKFKKGIADAYNNIALNDENMGNLEEAKANYFKSLKVREEIGGSKGLSFTYNNLGNLYRRQSNYSEALIYFYKSLKLKEELNDKKGAALTLTNIGLIYVELGETSDAFKNYSDALKYYNEINDKNGLAMVYNNRGLLNKKQGKFDEAISDFNKALSYNRETGNKNWISSNLTNIGGIYLNDAIESIKRRDTAEALKNYNNAFVVLNEANDLNETSGNKYNYSANLVTLGEVNEGLGNYEQAQKNLQQAVAVANAAGIKTVAKDAYLALSRLDNIRAALSANSQVERINFSQSALRNYVAAQAIKDSIFNEENSKQLAEVKTRYETERKDKEIALLNTEKNLQQLSLKEQQAALMVSRLQSDKTRSEMELLNQSKVLQEMQLTKTQQELVSKMLEAKTQSAELELEKKDKALKEQQLGKEQLFRNVFLVGSLVLILVAFLLFNRYKLNQKLEHQQNLINQRKNISADLHDDVGSTLSSISIYSEAIKNKLHLNEPEKVMDLVHKIGENARETITNLSDIVWTINPVNDSGEVVLGRMESFASSILGSKNMKLEFHCDPVLYKMEFGMELRQNLFLIFKEAINNAAKYSKASLVQVDLGYNNSRIHMKINDNGCGFKQSELIMNGVGKMDAGGGGNGLKNMQLRANQLNGRFGISSSEKGTSIELEIPSVPQIS
ncbi:MAG TPA: tetratricopeptide repeat protein [Bacteroidia bacterium]|nr:tetratricopeptide repeat protein [Bacteroidia bacterium]